MKQTDGSHFRKQMDKVNTPGQKKKKKMWKEIPENLNNKNAFLKI